MKKYVPLLTILSVSATIAAQAPESFPILVRKPNGRPEIAVRSIPGLKPDRFETVDFKVVLKKSRDALPTSTDEALRLRAATVLYHLTLAKRYFLDRLKSDEANKLEQVVVRLELTNQSNRLGHFAHDNLDPQFNNALSIPAGKGMRETPPWDREIWFRPKKEIPIGEELAKLPEDPYNAVIRQVNSAILPNQVDVGIRNFVAFAFSEAGLGNAYLGTLTRQAGTLLMIEGALQISKFVNRMLIPQKFYLDSAMVPEIIYHEFTHIVLSDYVPIGTSTAVNEGLADYFAADIGGDPTLAGKIKKYSTSLVKKGKKKKTYEASFESKTRADADFVLTLLWGMRDVLGGEKTTQIVFESRKYLTSQDADIRGGLVKALIRSCGDLCENPDRDRLKLNQYFYSRGL